MREYLNRMERDGVQRVKMFLVITAAYVLFWGPLFFVTLVNHPIVGNPLGHEVSDAEKTISKGKADQTDTITKTSELRNFQLKCLS